MKKLLLFTALFIAIASQAQDFWTEYSTAQPYTPTGVRSISIVDQNITWLNMVQGDGLFGVNRTYAKTNNGGTVWTTAPIDLGINTIDLDIANICGVSSMVAYAAAYPIGAVQCGIWKTEDGGTNWIRQNSAAFSDLFNSFPVFVHFWNANEGLAVGDPTNGFFEIYTTSNGGNLWTRLASTPVIVPVNSDEYINLNKFEVNANTIWVGTTSGRILKSTDKGLNWTASQSPVSAFGDYVGFNYVDANLAFSDLSNGLLQTYDNKLYKTVDGGTTWTEVFYNGLLRNFDITAVPGLANTYISVGSDSSNIERGSSYTVDGGNTWISINNNPDTNFVNGGVIEMLDADHGFAGGFNTSPIVGGVFKWGGGALLRQAQLAISTFSDDKAVTVYPNPTSGILNINAKNIKQIEVIDLLGKQIVINLYNSLETVNLNLDFLNSGVYMLRVTNHEGIFVSKVIKE